MKRPHPLIQIILSSPCASLNRHLEEIEQSGDIKRLSKYGNLKTVVDEIVFDSQKEAARYGELKMLIKKGEIGQLKIHEVFELHVKGKKIASYEADFVYYNMETGERIVEDVKSEATRKLRPYRLKKKLMKAIYQIEIKEV